MYISINLIIAESGFSSDVAKNDSDRTYIKFLFNTLIIIYHINPIMFRISQILSKRKVS